MGTMRKVLAALVIVGAGSFVAHGATAPPAAAPSLSHRAPAVTMEKGTRITIDRPGAYRYTLVTAPGLSRATAMVNSGFAVQGGTAEFSSPPRTILRDTPSGLEVIVSFAVTSFTGSPALVLQGATITPR